MDMALGCSTNSMLHLPAIAHECGVDLNLEIANELSEKTRPVSFGTCGPNLCWKTLNAAGEGFCGYQ